MIDQYNILVSTNMAMNGALKNLKVTYNMAIIDGKNLTINYPNKQIVKGDSCSLRIALASNIAKVVRDNIMRGYSRKYPQFAFEKNKGYGTRAHLEAIDSYGPTPFHRLTFRPLIEIVTENKLKEWLQSGQIDHIRYDMILSKFKGYIYQQNKLTDFL